MSDIRHSTCLAAGLLVGTLVGCATDGEPDVEGDGTCSYPSGAVEPMAVGEVLFPYAWPVANRADGTEAPLDLSLVPCAADAIIDWSPHDLLLFVSIPAW